MKYVNPDEDDAPQVTPEEFLSKRKKEARQRSLWAIGIGLVIIAVFVFLIIAGQIAFEDLFYNIIFILGLFVAAGGLWGLYQSGKMKIEDFIPSPEAVAFAHEAETVTPYYSYIFIGCFIAVQLAQMSVGLEQSADIAGLIKSAVVDNHEYWRLITSGALHYGLLHIYFNSQAFYGFGTAIEFLSNRAHLAIVFVLAVLGGSLLSLVLMPNSISVGASGGIMGLIGYLVIYGYRRKSQLPPGFLKSMMINIAFIGAFGIIGYQVVNNAAHLGGLIVGAIYGFLQVPRNLEANPRQTNAVVEALGMIAVGIFVFASILSILLITGTIKF